MNKIEPCASLLPNNDGSVKLACHKRVVHVLCKQESVRPMVRLHHRKIVRGSYCFKLIEIVNMGTVFVGPSSFVNPSYCASFCIKYSIGFKGKTLFRNVFIPLADFPKTEPIKNIIRKRIDEELKVLSHGKCDLFNSGIRFDF